MRITAFTERLVTYEDIMVDIHSFDMLSGVLCTDNDGNQYVVHGLFTQ